MKEIYAKALIEAFPFLKSDKLLLGYVSFSNLTISEFK
jgi:hypothetical protein